MSQGGSFLSGLSRERKYLAILIDPDKMPTAGIPAFLEMIPERTTHLFVGGSTVPPGETERCVAELRKCTSLPLILFPGASHQITGLADAVLFLSLISGRNPEYLIGQQVKAVKALQYLDLEIIPTGYILIDGGKQSAVERISGTLPLSQDHPELIVHTALAGEYLGNRVIYLEAGSGASRPVDRDIIKAVSKAVSVPVIVGGGIRNEAQLAAAYEAGADLVVVGTALEEGKYFRG